MKNSWSPYSWRKKKALHQPNYGNSSALEKTIKKMKILPAFSTIKLLEHRCRHDLLEVTISTGRPHQIRIHSSHCGHPIFGDEKYGGGVKKCKGFKPDQSRNFAKILNKFGRHALHALSIEFKPYKNNGKKIKLAAPIPNEFVDLEKSILLYER